MYPVLPWISALVLQVDVDLDFGVDPATGVFGSAAGSFLTTLIVAAILVAVVPRFTEDRMAAVLDDPVGSFVYGLAVFLVLILVAVLLVLTFVGIVIAIPLLALGYVVWAVGSAVAFLAIADRLVGHDDGWTTALVVAAAMSGGLVLTGVGGIVAFCIGAAGFGAVLEDRL